MRNLLSQSLLGFIVDLTHVRTSWTSCSPCPGMPHCCLFNQGLPASLRKGTAGKMLRQSFLLCRGTKPAYWSLALQGMLEDLHGNATASGLSAAAAKTLRDTAQEDFETFEASEVDEGHEMNDKASDEGDFSGEDGHVKE